MPDPLRLTNDGRGFRYVRVPSSLAHLVETAIEKALEQANQEQPEFMKDRIEGQTMVVLMRDR